jgi:hypothetical protein
MTEIEKKYGKKTEDEISNQAEIHYIALLGFCFGNIRKYLKRYISDSNKSMLASDLVKIEVYTSRAEEYEIGEFNKLRQIVKSQNYKEALEHCNYLENNLIKQYLNSSNLDKLIKTEIIKHPEIIGYDKTFLTFEIEPGILFYFDEFLEWFAADKIEQEVEAIVNKFIKKHNLGKHEWRCFGEVLTVSDYEINFSDVKFDIENNIEKGKFFEWYDYVISNGSQNL